MKSFPCGSKEKAPHTHTHRAHTEESQLLLLRCQHESIKQCFTVILLKKIKMLVLNVYLKQGISDRVMAPWVFLVICVRMCFTAKRDTWFTPGSRTLLEFFTVKCCGKLWASNDETYFLFVSFSCLFLFFFYTNVFFFVYRCVISVIPGCVKSVGVPKCFQKLFNILVSFTFTQFISVAYT